MGPRRQQVHASPRTEVVRSVSTLGGIGVLGVASLVVLAVRRARRHA